MKKKLVLLVLLLAVTVQFVFSANHESQGIRGVWVPSPRFTSVLHTYQGVKDFVKQLNIDFGKVKEYISLFPDRVYRNIYQGGLMSELV